MPFTPKPPARGEDRGAGAVQLTLAAASVLCAAFCLVSALLFGFPKTGLPGRVDAIVVLGGGGDRLGALAVRLAQEDKASYLVISRGLPWDSRTACAPGTSVPAKVICFKPNPPTTQGEAEDASRIARNYRL